MEFRAVVFCEIPGFNLKSLALFLTSDDGTFDGFELWCNWTNELLYPNIEPTLESGMNFPSVVIARLIENL